MRERVSDALLQQPDRHRCGRLAPAPAALWAAGYAGFWVLDNFGNPICEATQPRVLDQLLDSLLRQNQRRATRTLYYYDVLAFGEQDAPRAARAIELHTR